MQDTTTLDPNVAHAMALIGPAVVIGIVFFAALYLIPLWQIVKKAGFHPALSLLVFVPLVNIIMLYVFAFSKWRVVPAPEYPYPPQFPPPPGYPPPGYPQTGYAAPAAYTPAQPTYPTPPEPPGSR